uniref:Uncharacterized protein n=1 Tax=Oryza glumipatula TaxID=40148 RepID=A0A0D9Y2V8_9ORYZ
MSSSSSASPSSPSATPPLPSPFSDDGGASAVQDHRLPPLAAVDDRVTLPDDLKSPTLARSDGMSSILE